MFKGVSHISIGVTDVERSLKIYRDILGLRIAVDQMEDVISAPGLLKNQQVGKRRAVYLRWQDGEHASFLVLSEHQGVHEGGPLRLDSVGIHHFSLWVDEIKPIYEKLQAAGVKFMVPLTETDTGGYGEAAGRVILTTIFADPDGTMVQLDQRT